MREHDYSLLPQKASRRGFMRGLSLAAIAAAPASCAPAALAKPLTQSEISDKINNLAWQIADLLELQDEGRYATIWPANIMMPFISSRGGISRRPTARERLDAAISEVCSAINECHPEFEPAQVLFDNRKGIALAAFIPGEH